MTDGPLDAKSARAACRTLEDRDAPARSQGTSAGPYAAGVVIDDKYRLVRQIGAGGMGTVWVAHNQSLHVHVAIKLIHSAGNKKLLADRLLKEARASARLRDDAIVRVYDLGTTPTGDPYIAMELLDGVDLATVLRERGRLDAKKALRIVLPIVSATSIAHDADVVHRDIKPENIFLARRTKGRVQPKLVDFGIAKVDTGDQRLTRAGDIVGSPAYVSPEQARGREADHRSDIWALCVVIYEMLTGELPFVGENYHAQLRCIIEDTPVPTTELAAGDQALWAILQRGLQKDAARRFQSARELGEALAGWLDERGIYVDITGNSLQTVWLKSDSEAPLDPLKPTDPPPAGRHGETAQGRTTIASGADADDSLIFDRLRALGEPSPVALRQSGEGLAESGASFPLSVESGSILVAGALPRQSQVRRAFESIPDELAATQIAATPATPPATAPAKPSKSVPVALVGMVCAGALLLAVYAAFRQEPAGTVETATATTPPGELLSASAQEPEPAAPPVASLGASSTPTASALPSPVSAKPLPGAERPRVRPAPTRGTTPRTPPRRSKLKSPF